MYSQLY